jgi:hypothetical protein
MRKTLNVGLMMLLIAVVSASACWAAGEDVLGLTGQYTFFIKPDPCSPVTYYQKMVPCVSREIIPVPRKVSLPYQVPVPGRQNLPSMVSETPMGCAEGQGPCTTCRPSPTSRPGTKEVWGPRMVTVRVPDVEFVPKEITRKVMLPQWFAVTEQPRPPQKIRKVRTDG